MAEFVESGKNACLVKILKQLRGYLSKISSCAFYKDISSMQGDLGAVTVDDGRHGEYHAIFVLDDRIHGAVPDYTEVLLQLGVILKRTYFLINRVFISRSMWKNKVKECIAPRAAVKRFYIL